MTKWRTTLLTSLRNSQNEVYDVTSGQTLKYREILENALYLGNLIDLPKQSVISIILPNSHDYIVTYLACVLYGYIFAPIPHFMNKVEVESILSYHEPRAVVTDRNDLDFPFPRIQFRINKIESQSYLTFEKLPEIEEEDVISLYYSSGTTGNPKGVLYTHENKFALIESIVKEFHFNKDTHHLAFLPFGHTAALNYSVFPSLFLGSPLFVSENFEKLRSSFFETISKYQINYTQIVPTVAQVLIKLREDTSNLNLSSIKYIGCGSAPLSLSVQNNFAEKFGLPLANLYGLSETGPSHIDDPSKPYWKPGSIGKALGVNQCRIADDGEILLKGKNIMKGYYKNDQLTKKTIIDGWFHTGDYGYEKNGEFYFLDRKKDLVIVGGINVYPAEIEDVLYSSNLIQECVVFGAPDSVQGERLVAYVSIKPSEIKYVKEIESKLYSICRNKLSAFKIPSSIYFIESIPKTASGKLLRRKIREEHLQTIKEN